jgi:hypothetical protein
MNVNSEVRICGDARDADPLHIRMRIPFVLSDQVKVFISGLISYRVVPDDAELV